MKNLSITTKKKGLLNVKKFFEKKLSAVPLSSLAKIIKNNTVNTVLETLIV